MVGYAKWSMVPVLLALGMVGCMAELAEDGRSSDALNTVCGPTDEFCDGTPPADSPPPEDGDGDLGDGDGTPPGDEDTGELTEADLPYDAKPQVGETWQLGDAFLEKGPLPAAILDVTMEGTPWRLEELLNNVPFVITEEDCAHDGNRDIGRDRIWVTWQNHDGAIDEDHLDMRYCK